MIIVVVIKVAKMRRLHSEMLPRLLLMQQMSHSIMPPLLLTLQLLPRLLLMLISLQLQVNCKPLKVKRLLELKQLDRLKLMMLTQRKQHGKDLTKLPEHSNRPCNKLIMH